MVEPDSAEPIWENPHSVSRSGGVAGVVELGDIGGEGRIVERARLFADGTVGFSERSRSTFLRFACPFSVLGRCSLVREKEQDSTDGG